MLLASRWELTALVALLLGDLCPNCAVGLGRVDAAWTARRKLDAREKTRDLWNHGFDHYMEHAFPMDELRPLTCTGRGPDWDHPENYGNNDVAGNFSVTLVDVLDTFVILGNTTGFELAVKNTIDHVSFDVDTKPQVFESTIRVMGGLLSGHIFASDSGHPFHLPWYRGQLLHLAHDLGKRLLPAFRTPTGLPYARLNLRHGVGWGETLETCTAGAGSLILEFATLSRLTGDDRFEKAAFKAFFAIWNRKSDISLVGNTIDTWTGKWLSPEVSSIGAGIDSFFEYALKWYILSGDVEFLDVWHEAYAAIMRYSRGSDGFWFRSVNIHTGDAVYSTSDSLSAFWPGLQVLGGDVENAIKSHLIYWNIWKRNSGLPEVWDINFMQPVAQQYPLRPEFVESTYYLYRATRDTFYLDVGERILYDITLRAKVQCGLTGILDLRTNQRDDRMESFVLSETLKYLYLLFDESNPLHSDDSNFVFTTEGHILTLNQTHLKPMSPARRKMRRVENLQCPAYQTFPYSGGIAGEYVGLSSSILTRSDVEYVRALVGALPSESEEQHWSPDGICEIPMVNLYSYDFILSPGGEIVPEDLNPSHSKLREVGDGYVLQNVSGIRAHIVSRLDGKGYDIVKLGTHSVLRGQTVYVNDTALLTASSRKDLGSVLPDGRARDVYLRFAVERFDGDLQSPLGTIPLTTELKVIAWTALFGGDPTSFLNANEQPLRFGHGQGVLVVTVDRNPNGCFAYNSWAFPQDAVVLIHRGECTFIEKLMNAASAGASGVVIISDDDEPVNPSADKLEIDAAGELLNEVVAVLIPHSAGVKLKDMMDAIVVDDLSTVIVNVEPEGQTAVTEGPPSNDRKDHDRKVPNDQRVLYLNGHPLLNTRLLI